VNGGGRRRRGDDDARLQGGQLQREPRQPVEDAIGKAQRECIVDVLGEACLVHSLAYRVNSLPGEIRGPRHEHRDERQVFLGERGPRKGNGRHAQRLQKIPSFHSIPSRRDLQPVDQITDRIFRPAGWMA
jgi:hypothetical protein